jgi:hypothetical protein
MSCHHVDSRVGKLPVKICTGNKKAPPGGEALMDSRNFYPAAFARGQISNLSPHFTAVQL